MRPILLLTFLGNLIYAIQPSDLMRDLHNNAKFNSIKEKRLYFDAPQTIHPYKSNETRGHLDPKNTLGASAITPKATAMATALTFYVSLSPNTPALAFNGDNRMSVADVKNQLQQMTGIALDGRDLYFNNVPLDEMRSLADYGLTNGAVLTIKARAPQVVPLNVHIASFSGEPLFTVTGDGNMTIFELKNQLQQALNVPAQDIHLYYNNHQLEDGQTLGSYGIKEGGTLQIYVGKEIVQQHMIDLTQFGGQVVPFNIPVSSTVHDIKMSIHDQMGHPYENMHLAYGPRLLNNSDLFVTYNIQNGSQLQLLNAMSLYECNGAIFTVYGSAFSKLIDLKRQVQQQTNVPLDEIFISYNGVRLQDDNKSLNEYNIPTNALFALCFKSHFHIQ